MTGPSSGPPPGPVVKDTMRQPLPKRFYKAVSVEARDGHYAVLLDGRPVRTPKKALLQVPTLALAEALRMEWAAQETEINPTRMPLTRLVNTAIDGVSGLEEKVAAEIVQYAGSDLLCYRATGPAALSTRQDAAWDPILAWAQSWIGCGHFHVTSSIIHVAQSADILDGLSRRLAGRDAYALSALHVITTLTGSAMLAVAHAEGAISLDQAWRAAHIDEDFQIEQWGADFEAEHRRAVRWRDMQAASQLLTLSAA
jgi:chaperone required for assembly of F1-ATPase